MGGPGVPKAKGSHGGPKRDLRGGPDKKKVDMSKDKGPFEKKKKARA